MKQIISIKSTQPNNHLNIGWAISNVCNFKCRYCFPGSNEGDAPNPKNVDLVSKNLIHLVNYYKSKLGKNFFHLTILGGEPTVWAQFGDFLEQMKSHKNIYISVLSNGSRTLRWWETYGGLIDNLTLSLHVSQANLDHSIRVADIVYKKGKKVTVQVMMDTSCWDQCVESISYMKKNSKYPWMIETKPIIHSSVNYTDEQKSYLNRSMKRYPTIFWLIKNIKYLLNGHIRITRSVATFNDGSKLKAKDPDYILSDNTKFTNWNCDIGVESILIDQYGNINGSCGQNLFGSLNILDSNFTKDFAPKLGSISCRMDSCTCLPATHASKIMIFC